MNWETVFLFLVCLNGAPTPPYLIYGFSVFISHCSECRSQMKAASTYTVILYVQLFISCGEKTLLSLCVVLQQAWTER